MVSRKENKDSQAPEIPEAYDDDRATEDRSQLVERYETIKYILSISYGQLERYDEKTNQLLVLIGLDFTVFGIFSSLVFSSISSITVRIVFITLVLVDSVLIVLSLYSLKETLSPHLTPIDHQQKTKRGMFFFRDILKGFSKEEYVDCIMGLRKVKKSAKYGEDDPNQLLKSLIEDCARDVYEQAEILEVKSRNIKRSLRLVVLATTLTLVLVAIISICILLGI